MRTTAWTSSTVAGMTTAAAVWSLQPGWEKGSRKSSTVSGAVRTASVPSAATKALAAASGSGRTVVWEGGWKGTSGLPDMRAGSDPRGAEKY
jgi:hypothetical protein